jgi:glycosyltransferase involved in cell wall biosynthesis
MITTDFSILENRRFDVCVVGSGPVGSCLAIDLAYRGLSVLVLESGLAKPDPRFKSLGDAAIVSPLHHHPMSAAVSRSLGGTSELWGGRCIPLDEIDFMKRDFIPNSGWPITYDDIARYERRAAELIGCDDGGFTTDDLAKYDGADINFGKVERWVNETRIIQQQPQLTSSNRIVILLNATVVDFGIEAGARAIKGVKVVREGQTAEFNGARDYVLALGGVETARLLLNVQCKNPQLFGGVQGVLGRYYMGHIAASFADIRFYNPDQAAYFSNLKGKRSFARRRLTLSPEAQLKNQFPNTAFWPESVPLADAKHKSGFLSLAFLLLNSRTLGQYFVADAIRVMQMNVPTEYRPHLKNLISDFGGLVAGTAGFVQQRYLYGRRLPRLFMTNPKGIYPLRFHSEQAPNPTNRVRLVGDRDWLGMNRAAIDLTVSPQELEPIKRAHQVFDRSIRSLSLGELIYHEDLEVSGGSSQVAPDGLHQIGLTRMASGPTIGIVDRDCRVFDFKNLYIAGSSVFPTAGQASPTLPAIALAMRLSERLARTAKILDQPSSISEGDKSSKLRARPLSILFVTASYYPAVRYGGPIYTVHSLARSLAERGNRVVVYTTNVNGEKAPENSTSYVRILDGVTVRYFTTLIDKIYWSSPMNRSLHEDAGQFDVVHAQGAFLYPTVAARRAASRNDIPFVYSPRGMLVDTLIKKKNFVAKSVWIKLFEVQNCKHSAFIHATSDIEAQEISRLGLRPRAVEVIPNGLDMPERESETDEVLRRSRLVGSRQPYIIILGRVSWKKGIDRLILAMKFVPSITLVIAGNDDENYTPQLMGIIREQGLEDRIVFTGAVYGMDKFALLRGAELFVLPSYSESFGVVLLEALCCGCPLIMTPEVGIAKDMEKFGAGIVVQGIPEEIGRAIKLLLSDPIRRKKMADVGKRTVLELYSWDGIATKVEDAYRRVLKP